MTKMILPSRHRILNSNPGGLRPSTVHLGHGGSPQYCSVMERRGTLYISDKIEVCSVVERRSAVISAIIITIYWYHCKQQYYDV